jgi:hypothetical protein
MLMKRELNKLRKGAKLKGNNMNYYFSDKEIKIKKVKSYNLFLASIIRICLALLRNSDAKIKSFNRS